ncbi:hypothetical protein PCYB_003720 [Plasmodium cynomolgi strain B]|uniref:CYIR protein n=1 Tax=Plasmodium cynomolgi (strain B) TaxID=1120755 RepID=K6UNM2_PLACD|nr:hypothetical protein PCYB_003720 [Plasmodium cynomolgi strain B]GAB69623.1 hypothetical protein PCYB_003720 [Plasmodium cynomolgi strain B]
MTLDSKIYTLLEFEEQNNSEFSQTNLNVLYKAFFNNECSGNSYSYYDYCEQDESYELKDQHRELYKKFERNLKLITNDTDYYGRYGTDNVKLCFYLKYWFYDQLIVNNFTNENIAKILKLWNERKEKKCANCDCEFDVKNLYEIKILKNIYDYFFFLDAYKDISKISTKISKKNYCKYVALGSTYLSTYEKNCKSDNGSFCKEFKKYIKKYVKLDDKNYITCDDASSNAFFNGSLFIKIITINLIYVA